MSWDRRNTEAEIGALLHAYLGLRHVSHPEGVTCHACIGMAEIMIDEAHKLADGEDFRTNWRLPWRTRFRLWTGELAARLAGHR